MNAPTPPRYDLHAPGAFNKVVSLAQYRAEHKHKDVRRHAPAHSRPRNDDPPPRAA